MSTGEKSYKVIMTSDNAKWKVELHKMFAIVMKYRTYCYMYVKYVYHMYEL